MVKKMHTSRVAFAVFAEQAIRLQKIFLNT